jgi:hypothetical protein
VNTEFATPLMGTAPTDTLPALQRDLAVRTGRGISNMVAGALLWTALTVVGALVADDTAVAVVYLAGAGLLFPIALAIARVQGLDPWAKGNPLGTLAGLLGGVQILYIPVLIGMAATGPQNVPWVLAVLVGAHLLPFMWVYRSETYLFAAATICVLAGSSAWLLPDHVATAVPATVAVVFAVTSAILHRGDDARCRRAAAVRVR